MCHNNMCVLGGDFEACDVAVFIIDCVNTLINLNPMVFMPARTSIERRHNVQEQSNHWCFMKYELVDGAFDR